MEIIRFHKAVEGPRKGKPVVTECIIKDGKRIVSGIALCSPGDKFSEYRGTDYARRRAKRKLKGRRVLPVNRIEAVEILLEVGMLEIKEKAINLAPKYLKLACELENKALLTI